MLAAKNYQAALFILRQLEFGLFDFRLHAEFRPDQGAKILETLAEIKKLVAVVPSPSRAVSRTLSAKTSRVVMPQVTTATCGLTYWRQMLSCALRKRAFSTVSRQLFLDNILSRGGSEEPMDLFKRFRGREPQLDAMLEHYGIKG